MGVEWEKARVVPDFAGVQGQLEHFDSVPGHLKAPKSLKAFQKSRNMNHGAPLPHHYC